MKTNQIMIRENEAFVQRTKDGYFSANKLLNDWNINNPRNRKEIGKYKSNLSTKQFEEQLIKEGAIKPILSSNKGTWMHPKMFIDFAMWVSVEFKSIVIDYVLDGLIKSRQDAGDYFNEMSAVILETHIDFYGTKPNPNLYIQEANKIKKMLNLHKKERNLMTEIELSNITQMQKVNSLLLKKKVGKVSRDKQLRFQAELLTLK